MALIDTELRVTAWLAEVRNEFGQYDCKLRGKTVVDDSNAETVNFIRYNANHTGYTSKARYADIPITPTDVTKIPCTATPIVIRIPVERFDQACVNHNMRTPLTKHAVRWINVTYDDRVIAAMAARTNVITLPVANQMTYAGFVKMREYFAVNESDGGKLYAILSPGGETDLFSDTTLINNFHFQNDTMKTATLPMVLDFELVKSNRLSVPAAGQRRAILWNENAVGVHIAEDFAVDIYEDKNSHCWMIKATMMMGACVIDPKGVAVSDIAD